MNLLLCRKTSTVCAKFTLKIACACLVVSPVNAQAPVLPVKGLIVVFDGSTVRSNARAYEYAKLERGRGVFKATLSNGASVNGFSGHIVDELEYKNPDLPALTAHMEAVAKAYPKAGAILGHRIPQFRALAQKAAASDAVPTPTTAAKSSPLSSTPAPVDEASRIARLMDTVNDTKADQDARISAISELAVRPEPGQLEFFARTARDPDKDLRKWGYRALGKIKNPGAFEKLLAIFKTPTLEKTDRIEVVKQFGRIGANPEEGTSLPALRELTTMLGSAATPAAAKAQAKNELTYCVENGGPWVRAHISSDRAPDVQALAGEIAEADAVRKQAVELELSMRFTAGDAATLHAYAMGKILPPRPLEGILAPITVRGRAAKIVEDLASEEAKVKRGDTISILDGPRNGMIGMYKHELTELKSEDPHRIARAALGRLSYITGKNVQNGRMRDVASDIADAPLDTYVDYQGGNQVSGPYHQAGDLLGSLVAGAAASYMNGKVQANADEAQEIVTMLRTLSPGAQKRLGF